MAGSGLDELREQYAAVEAAHAADKARSRFVEIVGACESPIERRFIGSILAEGRTQGHKIPQEVWDDSHSRWSGGRLSTGGLTLFSEDHWWLFIQFPASINAHEYRCDFALRLRAMAVSGLPDGPDQWFDIECDGHDFHERTKEQAARDRARDRDFMGAGWHVVRFTGSEIARDPMRCVEEMVRIARNVYAAGWTS